MNGMTQTTEERIGIFGGTFNPIHHGHLRAAEEIREHFVLSRVFFVPARIPPHKHHESIASPVHRLRMVQLAIEGNASFAASDFELSREKTSYSIFTIEHFHRRHNSPNTQFFFLMGVDSFMEIPTWKDYTQLFSLTHIVVMSRPGFLDQKPATVLPFDVAEKFNYNAARRVFTHDSGHHLYFHQITMLEISSSDIRRRIGEHRSVRYLIPETVEHYVAKHGLYQAKTG